MYTDKRGISHSTKEAARRANDRYDDIEQEQEHHEELLRAQRQTQQVLADQNRLLEKQAKEKELFHDEIIEEQRQRRVNEKKFQRHIRLVDWLGKSNNEDRFLKLLKMRKTYLASLLFAPAYSLAIESSSALMDTIRSSAQTLVSGRIDLKDRIDNSKKVQSELIGLKQELAMQSPGCTASIVMILLLSTICFGAYRFLEVSTAVSPWVILISSCITLGVGYLACNSVMRHGEKKVEDMKSRLAELQARYDSAEYQRQIANNHYTQTKEDLKVLIESWVQLVQGDLEKSVAETRESNAVIDRFTRIFEKSQRMYPSNVRANLLKLETRMIDTAVNSMLDAEWPKHRKRILDTDMICLHLIRHGATKDYDSALSLLLETGVEPLPDNCNYFNLLTEKSEVKQ